MILKLKNIEITRPCLVGILSRRAFIQRSQGWHHY